MLRKQFRSQFPSPPFLALETAEKIGVGNVRLIRRVVKSLVKNPLELLHKLALSTHQLRESIHIVRNIETVVPRRALVKSRNRLEILSLTRVERLKKLSLFCYRTKAAILLVVVVLISKRPLSQSFRIVGKAQRIRQTGQRIVCDIIFERVRHRVVSRKVSRIKSKRDVALFHIRSVVGTQKIRLSRSECRLVHSLVSFLNVEIPQSLHPAVHNHRHSGVSLHHISLPPVEFPFRHPAPFFIHSHHRPEHIYLFFRIDERHQLVEIAVGVPKREHSIACPRCPSDLAASFHKRIFPIDVVEYVRMDKCMI